MKILAAYVVFLVSVPAIASAQAIGDFFGSILKEIKGVTVWGGNGIQSNGSVSPIWRGGFSVKYGEFSLYSGSVIPKDTLKLIEVDSIVCCENKEFSTHKKYSNNPHEKKGEAFATFSLNLGYETSLNHIVETSNYRIPATISATTLLGVIKFDFFTMPISENLSFVGIVGGGFVSLSSPQGSVFIDSATTIPIKTTCSAFAPEIGFGISYKLLGSVQLFLDYTRQYVVFENPTVERTTDEPKNQDAWKKFPNKLDYTGKYFKFGISIDFNK